MNNDEVKMIAEEIKKYMDNSTTNKPERKRNKLFLKVFVIISFFSGLFVVAAYLYLCYKLGVIPDVVIILAVLAYAWGELVNCRKIKETKENNRSKTTKTNESKEG